MTRAKKVLVIIGEKKAVAYAVRNETTTLRNTRLAERLRDLNKMEAKFKIGDIAYIVENNRFTRRVIIIRVGGGLYTVRFMDSNGATRVRKGRLFPTEKEAEESISGKLK